MVHLKRKNKTVSKNSFFIYLILAFLFLILYLLTLNSISVEHLAICVTNAMHTPTIQLSVHPPIFTFCQSYMYMSLSLVSVSWLLTQGFHSTHQTC